MQSVGANDAAPASTKVMIEERDMTRRIGLAVRMGVCLAIFVLAVLALDYGLRQAAYNGLNLVPGTGIILLIILCILSPVVALWPLRRDKSRSTLSKGLILISLAAMFYVVGFALTIQS
jgi:uncharacterized membrane protein